MQRLQKHPLKLLLKLLPLILIILWTNAADLPAQTESLSELIRYRIDTLRTLGYFYIGETRIASTTLLPRLYENNQYAPLWTDSDKIDALINVIDTIDAEGLEPEDYHHSEIQGRKAFLDGSDNPNNLIKADLEMLLTDALILLQNHLSCGKVDPQRLNPNWDFNRNINDRSPLAVTHEILSSGNLSAEIDGLKPQHPTYAKLKTALAHYRSIAAMGGWQAMPPGITLKTTMRDDRVIYLRRRLATTGNLPSEDKEDNRFDDELKKGVIQFQKQHGLTPDGMVGGNTLTALNVPVEKRIDQIRANLERARWCPHSIQDRFVLVDVAGFRLRFYSVGNIIWSSRIQIAAPFHRTPVFRDNIRYIEFNPAWNIPPKVTMENILPEINQSPHYLADHQIKVLDMRGRRLNAASLDWSLYPAQNFPYILRQSPGPSNTLGSVKFMFPNPHMIFLHDAPSKNLLTAKKSVFKLGCIQVEKPLKLAELLLDDRREWNQEKFQKIIATQTSKVIYLKKPVPVLLQYWTVAVDNSGIVYFRKDIYDRDGAVIKGLKADHRRIVTAGPR